MDGNGRWADQRGLQRVEGHRVGVQSVRVAIQACLRRNIPVLSLFAFSSENWLRPSDEVDYLMQLFLEFVELEIDELHEKGVALRFIGDRARLPDIVQTTIASIEALTKNNQALTLNILMSYGGRWDIVQAAKAFAAQVLSGQHQLDDLDEALFSTLMSTYPLPDLDLLIRTSGELRISNFYLWQSAYTELYFTELLWPDFSQEAFDEALANFSARKRRYGKTNQQWSHQHHA